MAEATDGGVFLGVDVGTSGVRVCAVNGAGHVLATVSKPMPESQRNGPAVEQDPADWWQTLLDAFAAMRGKLDLGQVRRLAVDGTSGTLLLIDGDGQPITRGLMYNDGRAQSEAASIAAVAPPESGAHGATSALAKLLHLAAAGLTGRAHRAVHQADWIAGCLMGRHGASDENNALKLGYDPVARAWPDWFGKLGVPMELLPDVHVPGTVLGTVAPEIARELSLSDKVEIAAGTTDGVAAFIATQAAEIGDGVTALGTTLTLKVLSDRPVFAPALGVYSHRLGDRWLAGGASNSGGAVLLQHFSREEIGSLSLQLDPGTPTGLDYYPLPAKGERFPVRDPEMEPRITPRPEDPGKFLQALLEGIAAVEELGYRRLAELGAPAVRRVITVGGGATNAAWTAIRERKLGVPIAALADVDTAFGTALLAWKGVPA